LETPKPIPGFDFPSMSDCSNQLDFLNALKNRLVLENVTTGSSIWMQLYYCDRTIPKDTQDYLVAEWALLNVHPNLTPADFSDLGSYKNRSSYKLHYFDQNTQQWTKFNYNKTPVTKKKPTVKKTKGTRRNKTVKTAPPVEQPKPSYSQSIVDKLKLILANFDQLDEIEKESPFNAARSATLSQSRKQLAEAIEIADRIPF